LLFQGRSHLLTVESGWEMVAAREHPARRLAVVLGDGHRTARVDADVGIGSGGQAMIRLSGEVTRHPWSPPR